MLTLPSNDPRDSETFAAPAPPKETAVARWVARRLGGIGHDDIAGRADPAGRMHVIGVVARIGQPHRPGAGEPHRAVAAVGEQGMAGIDRRQLRDVPLHRRDDRRAQFADFRLDARE